VPAFNFLWSAHDEILHHHRRYNKRSLIKAGQIADIKWSFISYYNFWLFLPVLFLRTLRKLFKIPSLKSDTLPIPCPLLNKIYYYIFNSEKYFLKLFKFPWGVSLIALIKRED